MKINKPFHKRFSTAGAITATLMLAMLTPMPQENAKAFDAASLLLTGAAGAGGFALGNEFVDQWAAAPYVAAGVLPMLVNWGYSIFKNKNDEDKIRYYISGRNYERWIRSQETWYVSTLDPYTGRPQAFTGLNSMNDGMPPNTQAGESSQGINHVYTVPVKMPAGTYGGVPYTERLTEFPKLP